MRGEQTQHPKTEELFKGQAGGRRATYRWILSWCWAAQDETCGLRMQDEKAEWLIYVTDEGQAGHFKLVFGAGRRWGIIPEDNPPRIDHVGFGLVLGSDGKRIRTRDMGAVGATRLPAPDPR